MINLWQIHSRDPHMEFMGKNKVGNTMWAKLRGLIGQKQFSVNSHGKFLCQYHASRRVGKQALGPEPFFLRILDAFHIFMLLF